MSRFDLQLAARLGHLALGIRSFRCENRPMSDRDMDEHGGLLDRLEAKLQEAHDASELPDEPTTVAALQDFVVRLRLDGARSEGS